MRFLITSDIHDREKILRGILSREPDLDFILHGGDQDTYPDYGIPFYSIPGNHEDFELLGKIKDGRLTLPNWNLLAPGVLHTIRGKGESVTVVGLGGTYSPKFSARKRRDIPKGREKNLSSEDITACLSCPTPDIFISHEASPKINTRGWPFIEEIVSHVKPAYAFSGHHHWHEERAIGNTTYIALAPPSHNYLIMEKKNGVLTHHVRQTTR